MENRFPCGRLSQEKSLRSNRAAFLRALTFNDCSATTDLLITVCLTFTLGDNSQTDGETLRRVGQEYNN